MNIIDFLEKMGQDAELRNATDAELEAALKQAGIDGSARAAILWKDQRLLESLLHADTNVCCMIARPMREDEEEEEAEETDGDQSKDAKDRAA